MPNRRRLVALQQQVAQRVEVALALRHLPPVHEQKAHVHPVPREGLVGRGLALRNLVFVVRKHQVFAARVQVEALAQVLHRHRRALDVPAGPAAADRAYPTTSRRAWRPSTAQSRARSPSRTRPHPRARRLPCRSGLSCSACRTRETRTAGSTSCRLRSGRRRPRRPASGSARPCCRNVLGGARKLLRMLDPAARPGLQGTPARRAPCTRGWKCPRRPRCG